MNAGRFLRHIFFTRWTTRRHFTPRVLADIEAAIREAESLHAGEIRFVVETALDLPDLVEDLPPRPRAMQVFGQLGVWDTAQNNGVLIYLLLADHIVEIVADRDRIGWSPCRLGREPCRSSGSWAFGTRPRTMESSSTCCSLTTSWKSSPTGELRPALRSQSGMQSARRWSAITARDVSARDQDRK